MDNNSSKYKNGSTSQLIKTGGGIFKGVIINSNPSPAAMSLTISDGLNDAGVATKAQTQLFLLEGWAPSSFALNAVTPTGGNVSDGDTFQIGNLVYTFRNTMTQAFDVKIEATIENSLWNMSKATRGIDVGTSCFAGTTSQGQVVYFYDPVEPESSAFVSRGRETFYNSIATVVTSGVLSASGDTAGAFVPAVPKEQSSFTLGSKTYCITTLLTDDVCGVFGIPTPVGTENEILDTGNMGANIEAAINGDGGAGEGLIYSFGTTPNQHVDCELDGTDIYFKAKNTGSYGNEIVAKSNSDTISLGTVQGVQLQTLTGGQDASQSVMVIKTSNSSDSIKVKPVEFYQGLYVTVGGTVDYTIIYS